ncbi:hypothetical protein DRJ19_05580 [Candidatus Woesearchaeota archaeon]|nr:MAG: hypothetical protein DRJ19_05580 [Candidatus Woesearchaeota archaeon]
MELNVFLFLAVLFILVYFLGRSIERLSVPWIFSALLVGLVFSGLGIFRKIALSDEFMFIAHLGMYFLLFIIGYEIDFKTVLKQKMLILRTTIFIVLAETVVGGSVLHFVFKVPVDIAYVLGLSFATVGEAALLPILDRFGLTRTELGKTAINVAVLDDVFEIFAIFLLSIILSVDLGYSKAGIVSAFLIVILLFLLSSIFAFIRKPPSVLPFPILFLFFIGIVFLFVGVAKLINMPALGALLSGIAIKNFVPKKLKGLFSKEIRVVAYGFFAPLFFFDVGLQTNVHYLISAPLTVLGFMALIKATKVGSTFLASRTYLGNRRATVLGFLMSIKFSTSIVVAKLFYSAGLITNDVFSLLIGIKILFKFIVPFIVGMLIKRWGIRR